MILRIAAGADKRYQHNDIISPIRDYAAKITKKIHQGKMWPAQDRRAEDDLQLLNEILDGEEKKETEAVEVDIVLEEQAEDVVQTELL
jgi:hypothetical protein